MWIEESCGLPVMFAPPANSCVDSLNAQFDNLSKTSLDIVHQILSLVDLLYGFTL